VGTLGEVGANGFARRADCAIAASVSAGVSASEESGDVGRVDAVLRFNSEGGRSSEVNEGDGGRGVGGRL
jgi:hypothetical protein